jgi:hypothetical protein
MDHYQVKFQSRGKTTFGICEAYGEEAVAARARGEVIVSDAVLPVRYRVREMEIVDIPLEVGRYDFKSDEYEGADEFHQHLAAECRKAKALSDGLPAGVQVGKLFGLGVADGTAWYVVTRVSKRTCRIEWRGFCLDRYYDHHFGAGGSFATSDVARYLDR